MYSKSYSDLSELLIVSLLLSGKRDLLSGVVKEDKNLKSTFNSMIKRGLLVIDEHKKAQVNKSSKIFSLFSVHKETKTFQDIIDLCSPIEIQSFNGDNKYLMYNKGKVNMARVNKNLDVTETYKVVHSMISKFSKNNNCYQGLPTLARIVENFETYKHYAQNYVEKTQSSSEDKEIKSAYEKYISKTYT